MKSEANLDDISSKRVIDFSKYSDYEAFSDGYYWMDFDSINEIYEELRDKDIGAVLNLPSIWNSIGSRLLNMPYLKIDGEYTFIIPSYSDSSESDVRTQTVAGDVVATLLNKPIIDMDFSNKTKIVLYNNRIVVDEIEDEDDANIANIVYNVVSLFLLQKIKRRTQNGQ